VGNYEAQEGRHRREAREGLREVHQGHRGGRACDPDGNPALADAIQRAKKISVPNDNIDRAVKRGGGLTGEAVAYDTIMYEAYAQGGVAMLIDCLTDNRNRAAAETRLAVTRAGGTMADPGSVSFNFERKGVIEVAQSDGQPTEDDILLAGLDAGLEEVIDHGEAFELRTDASDLVAVRSALQEAGIDYESAEAEFVANVLVPVDLETAKKVLAVIDAVEDLDDVQNVFTNMEIPADVQEQLDAE
jgi:YebC/PmpR family DNA-binding regulatory protein